jgi:hypothetical protein
MSNNDYNWRLVAAEAIEENRVVTINSTGKAAKTGAKPVGIVPQPIAQGERAPVMRGGTVSGLSGFTAGDKLRGQSDGVLGTAGSNPVVAVVKSEDASTAVILTGNLDAAV